MRYKFDDRTERCIYPGISQLHAEYTFKLRNPRRLQAIYRRNVKIDENSLPCRMDRKANSAIRLNKDDRESGESNDDHHNDIFHPSAGAANDRVRPTDESDNDSDRTDPDNKKHIYG